MEPRYSESYIDEVVQERNRVGLHQLIPVVERRTKLPDELWAFNRQLEWLPRSGVWQYYEGIDRDVFARLKNWLLRVGWQEVHDRYAEGMLEFSAGGYCEALDRWINEHEDSIMTRLWSLVIPQVAWLKTNAGS